MCPLHLVLSLGVAEKSLAPSFFSHPRYFYTLAGFPLRFLFFRLISHSSLSLSSHIRFSKPLDIFMALSWTHSSMSVSLVVGSPALGIALHICLARGEQREGITSLDLLVTFCLIQPRRHLTSFAARVHCWFMFSLVSTRTPQVFSAKLLFSSKLPWCLGLFLTRSRI